jgi:hypothetical protein
MIQGTLMSTVSYWRGGAEDIYKVFFTVESRTYFVLKSNLRKVVRDESK